MDDFDPRHLGKSSDASAIIAAGSVQADLLERIPYRGFQSLSQENKVTMYCPEFTSLCPVTGQPDFAQIIVEYVINEYIVESKSLKLYLLSYRNVGMFHEQIVANICDDLFALLKPLTITVVGEFSPRGGIAIRPTARRELK